MTTKRARRPEHRHRALKALLLTGSVVATLAGAQLLPLQERADAALPAATAAPVTVVVPAADGAALSLPPAERGTQAELRAIPQIVQPQLRPVARTRSSR